MVEVMEYEKGTGVSGGGQCAWLVKRVPGHLDTGFGDLSQILCFSQFG